MARYTLNATNQTIDLRIVDDLGLPVTGLVAATLPDIFYAVPRAAAVQITLSDLTAITDAHSDGGVFERSVGLYRLDLPDAVFSAAGAVVVFGEETDKRVIADPIDVGPVDADLTDAAQQQVSRIVRGSDFVYVAHDGNDTTSGATLKAAVEAASAGETVIVGAGTFAEAANRIDIPVGVSIVGAGPLLTIINGTKTGTSSSDGTVRIRTGSAMDGLTIDNLAGSGGMAVRFDETSGTNHYVSLRNVRLRGDLDAFRSDLGANNTLWLNANQCDMHIYSGTLGDAMVLGPSPGNGAGTYIARVRDSIIAGESNGLLVDASGTHDIVIESSRISVYHDGPSGTIQAVFMEGDGIVLVDCTLQSDIDNGDPGDSALDINGNVTTIRTSYDPDKISGTVTQIDTPGDVTGKVLGGGSGTITATGVRADDRDGEAVAKASIATESRLAELDAANLPKTTDDTKAIVQAK